MSRIPLLMLVFLGVLGGCSSQSGTGGASGGGGSVDGPDPDPTGLPSSGIPDFDSLSVSVDIKNPRALEYDGEKVTFTVRLADQLG
ncbi:MAG TPA: hypothetical protein VFX02_05365, partial [Gammaproteobacteria bacterium]|nr:hypothetical protein [Gammaproteobacteria bacterium]